MTSEVESIDRGGLRAKSRLGIWVAVWLGVLTAVEYLIAVNLTNPLLLLLPFVLAKGWLILRYFMHVRDLFGEGH